MPKLKVDYTGQTIGNRFVLGLSHFTHHSDPMWSVRCVCGYEFTSLTQDLKRLECRNCRGLKSRKRPFESLYNTFVQKASKRYPVEITYEQFVIFTKVISCHYCYRKIEWSKYQTKGKGTYRGQCYNLDRKDNSKNYTFENCVVCCAECNSGKGRYFTYDQWYKMTEPFRKGELCHL